LAARGIPVIVVHGLWMSGLETFTLRGRLARAGFVPRLFRYPSTRASLGEAAAALAEELRGFGAGPAHLLGHSLGGLVILETFERERRLPDGRVVLLGSPVRGSRAARAVASWAVGPQLLGSLATNELTRERQPVWRGPQQLGVIAGSRSVGMGRMLAELPVPNDGTVAVDETGIPGLQDQAVFDVSHLGMLLSAEVAGAVIRFLDSGHL
jgi:pimeloyl-ACP methyl ester carboxylesterase